MKRLLSLCALVLIASCASTPDDTTVEASPTEADDYTPFAIQFILRAPANAPEEWVETTMREALDTFVVAWTGERYPLDAWAALTTETGSLVLLGDEKLPAVRVSRKRAIEAVGSERVRAQPGEGGGRMIRFVDAPPDCRIPNLLWNRGPDFANPDPTRVEFTVADLGVQNLPGTRALSLVVGDCEAVNAVANYIKKARRNGRVEPFSATSVIDWQRVVINYD